MQHGQSAPDPIWVGRRDRQRTDGRDGFMLEEGCQFAPPSVVFQTPPPTDPMYPMPPPDRAGAYRPTGLFGRYDAVTCSKSASIRPPPICPASSTMTTAPGGMICLWRKTANVCARFKTVTL